MRARDSSPAAGVLSPGWAWSLVVLALACTALYATDVAPLASLASSAIVGIGGIAAVGFGIRGNHPALRRPWRLLQTALVIAMVGSTLRAGAGDGSVVLLVANMIGMVSYVLFFLFLLGLLRARDADTRRDALADGALVGIAAVLLAWVLLVSPALANVELTLRARLIDGFSPVLDALLVYLLVRLSFVTPRNVAALWLLMVGFLSASTADLGWALTTAGVLTAESAALDSFYLATFGLAGAAALHPSMRVLAEPLQAVVRPLPRFRLVLVSLAVAAPALLVLTGSLHGLLDRVVVAAGILVLAALVLVRTIRAVDGHVASELRLARQATHDALTDLPNRVRLGERLSEALSGLDAHPGRYVAVLFLDLDGFKLVNDSWGHSVGDELLVAAAARLRQAEQGTEMVTRAGGDEFVIVCECADAVEGPVEVARRVLAGFAAPFTLSIGEIFITVSIGIAMSSGQDDQSTPEALIRDADTAMYRAKGEGRNRWALFDASMRASVTERLRTEVELRRALEREELVVHYQPIVGVADGALHGFEALVRWEHPERGLVMPGAFIPVIEDSDLIVSVGALVLRRAAAQLALWRSEHPREQALSISVNVAARQLRDPAFVQLVRRVLVETSLPPETVTLEITESTMVEDSAASRGTLAQLRALGVGLAVDDFGTGYSSLRYLKEFPMTSVKIDRAFVDGLGTDPDDEVIVEAVLAMTHALGLTVVAEGVETLAQRERLLALGCDAAQGYLFGRPLPATSASRLITRPSLASVSSSSMPKVIA